MSDTGAALRFWERGDFEQLPEQQWESLCDGCGRCCLQKLEDVDSGEVCFTRVACRLLDPDTCRCRDYDQRFSEVPDCTRVRPLTEQKSRWLPLTCAYRLLARRQPLPDWHPLLSGDADSVHAAGISVRNIAVSEAELELRSFEDYEPFVIEFPEPD